MGEVYRARDLDLLRDVAVKFLPEPFASSPVRLSRFTREARAASSLNHPNVLTVHEVGQVEGLHFIVTELVEGMTLRQLIRAEHRLSVRRTLDLAVQVADGLAEAHAAGVVHRDLKPENLMVTADGRVKILDFGLAKLHNPPADADPAICDLPTWPGDRSSDASVSDGTLIGTVGYVSPEQARGKPADHRSDQFALGATIYEMVAGQQAFHRESRAETLAAILDREPKPLADTCPELPAPARWIVERCLAKEPTQRYASTLDLAHALRSVREHLSELEQGGARVGVATRTAHRLRSIRNRLRLRPQRVAAAAVLLALLAAGLVRGKPARWAQTFRPASKGAGVAAHLSQPVGPSALDPRLDDLALEVMTFRWTRPDSGKSPATAEPVVVEGRVERRGDWLRITVRRVDAAGPNHTGGSGSREGDLLGVASTTAQRLEAVLSLGQLGRDTRVADPPGGP
jgi:aminoglycoside phosphotransferase (APT) family kinase protein